MIQAHTQVRVVVVLIKRSPEEGPDNAGALDGAKGEVQDAHHVLVALVSQGEVVRREGLWVLCI
jgi:hypothetical protein